MTKEKNYKFTEREASILRLSLNDYQFNMNKKALKELEKDFKIIEEKLNGRNKNIKNQGP